MPQTIQDQSQISPQTMSMENNEETTTKFDSRTNFYKTTNFESTQSNTGKNVKTRM